MQKNGTASAVDNRIDQLKDQARRLVDAGSERAGELKNRAIDVKDTVFAQGSEALNRVSALVKANPFVALGIAFGVGYVAIRMLRK
jgi:ElaB/YqjD/DUF883 family membrane-anchored ribosome-binding protein